LLATKAGPERCLAAERLKHALPLALDRGGRDRLRGFAAREDEGGHSARDVPRQPPGRRIAEGLVESDRSFAKLVRITGVGRGGGDELVLAAYTAMYQRQIAYLNAMLS
jgi:hypothetical protein